MQELSSYQSEYGVFSKELSMYERIAVEASRWEGSPSRPYVGPEEGLSFESGFDCSGFVTFVLKNIGVKIPENIRHANEYFDQYGISVQHGLQEPGDLIFFTYDGAFPAHMGIVLSPSVYIHAPGKDNAQVEIMPIQKTQIDLRGEGPFYYHTNPIGFKRPMEKIGRYNYPLATQIFPKLV